MTQFKWFFDFQLINDDTLGYSYIKQPKNMSFEQSYLKQMYQLMIKNNGITYKEIDKILLRSTNCFSLLFHKNLNQNKIIYQEDYQKFIQLIKKLIIQICEINYSKTVGKCSEKNYSKIKTILENIGILFTKQQIRMIGFLFSKKQIKQTKLIIKNCCFKNIQIIEKFPKLFLHHDFKDFNKNQIYLIIKLILNNLNIEKYNDYKWQFLDLEKNLKTDVSFLKYKNKGVRMGT